jgi:hypothetical protein
MPAKGVDLFPLQNVQTGPETQSTDRQLFKAAGRRPVPVPVPVPLPVPPTPLRLYGVCRRNATSICHLYLRGHSFLKLLLLPQRSDSYTDEQQFIAAMAVEIWLTVLPSDYNYSCAIHCQPAFLISPNFIKI